MFNPEKEKISNEKIKLSQNIIDINESLNEINKLDEEDFENNIVLTRELSEKIILDRIKKERLWNLFVDISNKAEYIPPQDRKTEILDLACSICEEKEVLHSFFGGEENPYYNKNNNVKITGVDIDKEAIELAKQRLPKGKEDDFKFIVGDASNLNEVNQIPKIADIVIIRHQQMIKPNYNKDNIIETDLWKKIITEGIKRLQSNGFFLITSYTKDEHEALLEYLKNIDGIEIKSKGENKYAEPLGAGGIDKYFVVIKKD